MVWSTPTTVQYLQVGGHGCWGGLQICWERGWSVENCPRQHGLVAFCSKPWMVEAIFEMWKEPCKNGPGCLRDPSASGMTGTIAVVAWLTEERIEREKFCEHLLPFSRFQANWDIAVMLLMVLCWVWLVGIVWQLVWKTTWQMEWKVGNTLRCRMVLPDGWRESVELECGWSCVRVADF